MNTSIGKRLALLLSGVLLLTGCYAAPAAESVRQGSTPPESAQPTQPPAAETAITTYPVPEENLLVSINMADSPSTGGFWQWDMMLHPYIEAYDPVTRTAYVPCYQSGCRHNDSTCSACFGNLSALAEYRDSLYALVQQDGESAASLVSRPLSGGALRVLASWEPENEGEKYRCALRCISFGKAYLTVTRAAYLPEDGQLTRDEQENRLVSVDLQTGEEATILEHAENYDLYGVWGDCAVFQVQETAEGAVIMRRIPKAVGESKVTHVKTVPVPAGKSISDAEILVVGGRGLQKEADLDMVKELAAGDAVSYGCTFRAPKPMRAATLAVGYADGYPRALSGRGTVSLHGRPARVLGRVCMDQIVVDVTDIPDVKAGDAAIVFGGGAADSVDDVARMTGTINYEVLCDVGRRVQRVYVENGAEVELVDYLKGE